MVTNVPRKRYPEASIQILQEGVIVHDVRSARILIVVNDQGNVVSDPRVGLNHINVC